MSKRKGLSADEKRQRLLSIFYERREVFQLKEVEQIAAKKKAVVFQAVKDVLRSLVDDEFVVSDKICASTFFWAFPSTALVQYETRRGSLTRKIADAEDLQGEVEKDLLERQIRAELDQAPGAELLEQLAELKAENRMATDVIYRLMRNDPQVTKHLQAGVDKKKKSVNRWTDNISILRAWIQQRFAMNGAEIERNFKILPDLDYKR